ncbi:MULTISPECIES: DsbE family thiol:disulfide interchange protein [Halomonadaceae]|uniref:DsbE family thiol:disulfide interchange protein n=1 Tax=Halomonas litopenaei TaxID=2109328 RepID=A0ABX5IZ71_9GAMM|nr:MULTISPECIES: DsbE family thiol:disulfide interchange protein [Halomonadaceae]KFF50354.1 thiol:disulfide interchange protein [Gammaproteobacteria bacterium MFB021]MED5297011.1 DsbE family thiol:disulfide interchange protein [Pseudomonadota bacterium]MBN8412693.1 DsbE family thiol:disulfide interchange protein [Halomonas litopenaei]MBY5928791.1 DsbE family thiol:disulfide interchange protein [Halomonas sp. DP8Y7-3]MBY5939294.1 DsbE family thiol:disulfide interchange protein [Halomonas sp. DP
MKRRLLLLIPLLVFLGLGFFLYRGLEMNPFARDSALLAKHFPPFTLTTLEAPSRRVDESLLKGEVTLVNVWAEWCPTCKEEMPQLLTLAERGVRLIGINYKDTRAKGLEFLDHFGRPFEVNIFDPDGDLGFELGVYGVPETFLVDTEGIIRYKHTGYITPEDVEKVIQEIEKWQQ